MLLTLRPLAFPYPDLPPITPIRRWSWWRRGLRTLYTVMTAKRVQETVEGWQQLLGMLAGAGDNPRAADSGGDRNTARGPSSAKVSILSI
jgi:hypothetical protein